MSPIKNDKVYEYELKSAMLYDLISKYNNIDFEISNKPINL